MKGKYASGPLLEPERGAKSTLVGVVTKESSGNRRLN